MLSWSRQGLEPASDVQTVTERALDAAFAGDTERKRLRDEIVRPGFARLRRGSAKCGARRAK